MPPPPIPRATYRLQFNRNFTFADARGLVPQLARLGISHIYASPWLKARAGSLHGYDIIDHNAIDPDIGSETDLVALSESLARHDMGHIVDFVPNHMGVGQADNAWWLDILEWGPASPYAAYFDIDWKPAKFELRGKVLLPFLGAPYGEVLENGELQLSFDISTGAFAVRYHEHRFPIRPPRYRVILARGLGALAKKLGSSDPLVKTLERFVAEFKGVRLTGVSARRGRENRVRGEALKRAFAQSVQADPALGRYIDAAIEEFNGISGDPRSFVALHRLLEAQSYRLAYWRGAVDEINYRRFFDINDLAGIRVELPAVFAATHDLTFRLIKEGKIQGLRIDHIDGLYDPETYCARLQERARAVLESDDPRPLYVVVEKILARHERLRESWPIAGTTGYEFANLLTGLLVDGDGERPLDRLYRRVSGRAEEFDDVLYAAKRLVIETSLASELHVLATELNRISEASWRTRDFTMNGLREALKDVVACFPVYRTYVNETGVTPEDRRDIDWAVGQARKRSALPDPRIFDFIYKALTIDLAAGRGDLYSRRAVIRFAMKFQQYTGPVMAKGMEDTSFYRYARFLASNEVGGDPRRFSVTIDGFHRFNQERAQRWPHAMLATATHDTKRGEDARARLAVLSELGDEWSRRVGRWMVLNRYKRQEIDDRPAPGRNDEYLLYQTLVGAWPVEIVEPEQPDLAEFAERIRAYATKASREAKTRTSWSKPDADYEAALDRFVVRILDPVQSRPFLVDMLAFVERLSRLGALNSLVQTALKLSCPGVPDIYQGAELWDLNLVDPDNRRPPDFALRARLIAEVAEFDSLPPDKRADRVRHWRENWRDGRIKLHLARCILDFRKRWHRVFADGGYVPLEASGGEASRVVAFRRRHEQDAVTILTGRCFARALRNGATIPAAETWVDTFVDWPDNSADALTDILTGRVFVRNGSTLRVASLFEVLPVAVLAAGP